MSSTPHEVGAGEISPVRASDPGLVFETTQQDYVNFLCFYGYSQKIVRSFTRTNLTCPKNTSRNSISTVNYPSISVGNLRRRHRTVVQRTATNVGSAANVTYVARIEAPEGLVVGVSPRKLVFGESVKEARFRVWFYGENDATRGYNYGSVVWTDGHHSVRLVFSVNIQ